MSPVSEDDSSLDRIEFTDPPASSGNRWTAFLAGDSILLDHPSESPFGPGLRTRMAQADLTLVNLEGPIGGKGDPAPKSGPVNKTVPRTPTYLADAGIDAVTLANNHSMDYGATGLFETIEGCRDADLGTAGAGENVVAALAPHRTTVADGTVRVALVSLCEREFGVAGDDRPGTAWINDPRAIDSIEATASETDVLIVAVHGGIEYVPFPPPDVRERYRALIEAGADLIVGHHPHVPQGWQTIDGVPAFYSLGNYLFDQHRRPNTSRGLALEVAFRGNTPVAVDLVPTELGRNRVRELPGSDERKAFLDHLHRLAIATEENLEPHWQEVADRVFIQRHGQTIRKSAGGDPIAMLRQPRSHLQGGALWDENYRQYSMLSLLNLVRNESHRSVIETSLALRTGVIEDERTPAVTAAVREFLEHTEDRPIYDPPSVIERGIQLSIRRMREAIMRLRPVLTS